VVRLALAIAARILHRQADLDPLLLTGAVRVALEKLGDSSRVVMRVPPREIGQWKEFFRGAGSMRIQPGVLEDPSLSAGECVLATELGTIELGVRAQLQEIEKRLFRIARSPADGNQRESCVCRQRCGLAATRLVLAEAERGGSDVPIPMFCRMGWESMRFLYSNRPRIRYATRRSGKRRAHLRLSPCRGNLNPLRGLVFFQKTVGSPIPQRMTPKTISQRWRQPVSQAGSEIVEESVLLRKASAGPTRF